MKRPIKLLVTVIEERTGSTNEVHGEMEVLCDDLATANEMFEAIEQTLADQFNVEVEDEDADE